ncbi:hypothetical protein Droror1_Dr00008099 [Drosera rotundifolia]
MSSSLPSPFSFTAPLKPPLHHASPATPPPPTTLSPPAQPLSTTTTTPLRNNPLYTQTQTSLPLNFKEKILCLEILGIDSGKALALNPALHAATLHSIHSVLSFLDSKGIHQNDLKKIVGMCPTVLTSSIRGDLIPVFEFLSRDLRVPEADFRRVVNKCPRLLVCSVRDQLRPALLYLKRLGFEDVESLVYSDPILFVSNVERTLMPKLEYLVEIGCTREEAVAMALRCPPIFTYSVKNNMKPKFEYFVKQMKGELGELKSFPQYFGFSLEKRIVPRHLGVLESGAKVPLAFLCKANDDQFMQLIASAKEAKTREWEPGQTQ